MEENSGEVMRKAMGKSDSDEFYSTMDWRSEGLVEAMKFIL